MKEVKIIKPVGNIVEPEEVSVYETVIVLWRRSVQDTESYILEYWDKDGSWWAFRKMNNPQFTHSGFHKTRLAAIKGALKDPTSNVYTFYSMLEALTYLHRANLLFNKI